MNAAADVIRLGLHQSGELSLIRVIQLVDLPVARNDAPCQDGVTDNECVECVLEHGVDHGVVISAISSGVSSVGRAINSMDRLAIGGFIPDPFQILRDLHAAGNMP